VRQATDALNQRNKIYMNDKLIEALKKELKGYELQRKADRAEDVKKALKDMGVKVETASKKPKAEKKVDKKAEIKE
jgi:hypothetical protein